MKKKILFLIPFSAMITTAFSQSTEIRELPPFSKIEIESVAKVYLRQDAVQSVKISSEGLLRKVETTVSNNTLYINGSADAELAISIAQLEKINIEGRGEIIGHFKNDSRSPNRERMLHSGIENYRVTLSPKNSVIKTTDKKFFYVRV